MMMCVINNSGGELELNEKELSILILLSSICLPAYHSLLLIYGKAGKPFRSVKKKSCKIVL